MEFHKNLLEYISQSLMTADETIAVAESVTSGCLQLALSQMPNASQVYKGGMTAYTLPMKVKLLNVDKEESEACDCVSEKIAETMAFYYKGKIIYTNTLELHPKTQALNAQLYYTEFILGCFKTEINKNTEAKTKLGLKKNKDARIKVS